VESWDGKTPSRLRQGGGTESDSGGASPMVYVALLLGCLRRGLRPNSARRPFSSRSGYQPTRARRPPLRVRMGGLNFAVPRAPEPTDQLRGPGNPLEYHAIQ
jgi:hypothetical protein